MVEGVGEWCWSSCRGVGVVVGEGVGELWERGWGSCGRGGGRVGGVGVGWGGGMLGEGWERGWERGGRGVECRGLRHNVRDG